MKKFHEYDFVHDTQKAFRIMLESMANPGRVLSLSQMSAKLPMYRANLTVLGLVLLDNEVSFFSPDQTLSESLSALTLSRPAGLRQADYIFLPLGHPIDMEGAVLAAKKGTLGDPHASATFLIEVPTLDIHPDPNSDSCFNPEYDGYLYLYGPGIHEAANIPAPAAVREAVAYREKSCCRFPLGIDFFFIDAKGSIMAIPRTTRLVSVDLVERGA